MSSLVRFHRTIPLQTKAPSTANSRVRATAGSNQAQLGSVADGSDNSVGTKSALGDDRRRGLTVADIVLTRPAA
jgi:hypothetical protein